MVKRMKRIGLLTLILLIPNLVYAASLCSYKEQVELNSLASNVKVTYEKTEILDGKVIQLDSEFDEDPLIDNYVVGFKINILNITDNIYVKVSNNFDTTEHTFKKEDATEGYAKFDTKKTDELVEYKIDVYSSHPSCSGELLRTFTLQTPIYNTKSNLEVCETYPDFYYCQEFLPTGDVSLSTFLNELEKYENNVEKKEENPQEEKSFREKIKEFYEKNKLTIYATTIAIIIISGVTATVILIKKKRSRVL